MKFLSHYFDICITYPPHVYLFKVSSRNSRKGMTYVNNKDTRMNFIPFSVVVFEQVNVSWLKSLLQHMSTRRVIMVSNSNTDDSRLL